MRFRGRDPLLVLTALACGYFVLALAVLIVLRIGYRFELEWIEGALLQQTAYLLHTGVLYPKPSIDHLPLPYAPLFFWLTAPVIALFGKTLPAMRLISIFGCLTALTALGFAANRITRSRMAGFLAAGLLASCYGMTGFFFDIARVDSLTVGFALAGLYFHLEAGRALRYAIFAGVGYGLATLTKQPAVLLIALVPAGAAVGRWFESGRDRLAVIPDAIVAISAVGTAAIGYGYLRLTEPWSFYYLFSLYPKHRMPREHWIHFFQTDLLGGFGLLIPLAATGLAWLYVERRYRLFGLLAAAFVALFVMSMMPRVKVGGYANTLMPLACGFALLTSLGFAAAREIAKRNGQRLVLGLAVLVVFAHFGHWLYDLPKQVPTARQIHAGNALITQLRNISGEKLFMGEGYFSLLLGLPAGHLNISSLHDISGADPVQGKKLWDDLKRRIGQRRYAMILDLSDPHLTFAKDLLEANYRRESSPTLLPLTGGMVGPGVLWLRR